MKHLKNAVRVQACTYYIVYVNAFSVSCAYYVPSFVSYSQILDYIKNRFDVARGEIRTYSPNEWAKLSAIEDSDYYLTQKCILEDSYPSATHIMGGYAYDGEWVVNESIDVNKV